MTLSGKDFAGRKLNQDEILSSVKVFCSSHKKKEELDELADQIGFNVEQAALEAVKVREPGQIVISIDYVEPQGRRLSYP